MLFYLGIICVLGSLYFLLSSFKIINKNAISIKPIEAQKVDQFIIRSISILTFCLGIYLIWPANEASSIKITTPAAATQKVYYWEQSVRDALTKQCLDNGKKTAEAYPELVNNYCTCATDQITASMSPEDYTKVITKSREEQAATLRPIVQSCVDILTRLIQLIEESAENPIQR